MNQYSCFELEQDVNSNAGVFERRSNSRKEGCSLLIILGQNFCSTVLDLEEKTEFSFNIFIVLQGKNISQQNKKPPVKKEKEEKNDQKNSNKSKENLEINSDVPGENVSEDEAQINSQKKKGW